MHPSFRKLLEVAALVKFSMNFRVPCSHVIKDHFTTMMGGIDTLSMCQIFGPCLLLVVSGTSCSHQVVRCAKNSLCMTEGVCACNEFVVAGHIHNFLIHDR